MTHLDLSVKRRAFTNSKTLKQEANKITGEYRLPVARVAVPRHYLARKRQNYLARKLERHYLARKRQIFAGVPRADWYGSSHAL